MSKHTPGPWTADECRDVRGNTTIRRSDGTPNGDTSDYPIATVYFKIDAKAEDEANAHLIAESPDLLEALKSALTAWSTHQAYDKFDAQAARAAIAKAEGENQTGLQGFDAATVYRNTPQSGE